MKRTLKGIRNDLNLTQKEMANKLNIPIATYQRYETGKTPMPIDVAIKIADYGNIVDLRILNSINFFKSNVDKMSQSTTNGKD